MRLSAVVFVLVTVVLLAGCTTAAPVVPAKSVTVDDAVRSLATHAASGDAAYFEPFVPKRITADRLKATDWMIEAVKAADVATTYRSVLVSAPVYPGTTAQRARLNYHDRGYFQIDLVCNGGNWSVSSIWHCK